MVLFPDTLKFSSQMRQKVGWRKIHLILWRQFSSFSELVFTADYENRGEIG